MGLKDSLEKIFAAAAFAESGEHEMAREALKEDGLSTSAGIRSSKIAVKEKGRITRGLSVIRED